MELLSFTKARAALASAVRDGRPVAAAAARAEMRTAQAQVAILRAITEGATGEHRRLMADLALRGHPAADADTPGQVATPVTRHPVPKT